MSFMNVLRVLAVAAAAAPTRPARAGSFTYVTIDPPGSRLAQISGLNERGDVVGYFEDGTRRGEHGFVWRGGAFWIVDGPGTTGGTYLTAINENGVAVGYTGLQGLVFNTRLRATHVIRRDYLVAGISNLNVIIGNSQSANLGLVDIAGSFAPLAPPGAGDSHLIAIDGAGTILGQSGLDSGFVYAGGRFTTIPKYRGYGPARYVAIAPSGKVVGYYGNGPALVFDGTATVTFDYPGAGPGRTRPSGIPRCRRHLSRRPAAVHAVKRLAAVQIAALTARGYRRGPRRRRRPAR